MIDNLKKILNEDQDPKAIELTRLRFLDATQLLHWSLLKSSISKLQGKEGNQEELFYFKKTVRI